MSATIRYNTNTGKLGFYRSKAEAGVGMPTYSSLDELEKCPATPRELVYFYNQITGEGVTRFSDRKTGLRRIWKAIENGYNGELNEKERIVTDEQLGHIPEAPEQEEKKSNSRGRPGRKPGSSSFAGKTIIPLRPVNPRRPGTGGFKSYEIIRSAGEEGTLYEDYIARGGRTVDLRWDIDHGFTKLA